ncbi:MAG: hypothetical protein WBP79_16565, partial [Candidatus Acidiferrales bacterium]
MLSILKELFSAKSFRVAGGIALGKQVTAGLTFCKLAGIILLASASCDGVLRAQQLSRSFQDSSQQKAQVPASVPGILQEETQKNPAAPCVEPAPTVRWEDYQGPSAKLVGLFARKLERRSVHAPHYKPGAVLCTLQV